MSKKSNACRRREEMENDSPDCTKCGCKTKMIEHRVGYPAIYSCDVCLDKANSIRGYKKNN